MLSYGTWFVGIEVVKQHQQMVHGILLYGAKVRMNLSSNFFVCTWSVPIVHKYYCRLIQQARWFVVRILVNTHSPQLFTLQILCLLTR